MRLLWLVLAGLLSGCGSNDAIVSIDLRTDLVPGVEFTGTAVSIDGMTRTYVEPAFHGEGFVTGRRIAELEAIPHGTYTLRVQVLDARRIVIAERPVRIAVRSDSAVTVVVTRDCGEVVCPAPDADPALSACIGARCVDPECLIGTEAACPDPACTSDADCPDDGLCGRGACRDAVCLTVADDTACAASELCVPGIGCSPREPDDAGVADAGPPDAGVAGGLVFYVDAADADGADTPGSAGCPAAASSTWLDLISGTPGSFMSFPAIPCDMTASGGWSGVGLRTDAHRLTFASSAAQAVSFGRIALVPEFTVEAWVRWNGTGVAIGTGTDGIVVFPIVAKGAAESESENVDINYALGISESGGRVATDFEDAATHGNHPLTGTTVLVPGVWYHLAATYDLSELRVFVNGVIDSSLGVTDPPSRAVDSVVGVGADFESDGALNGGHFDGDIAIVRIFERGLTPAEILSECNDFAARFDGLTCGP